MISFLFFGDFIVFEIPGDGHLDFRWADTHFKEELIKVDILRTYRVGGSIVAYKIKFDFNDSEHGGLKHVFEEEAFLWMDELIVAVFEDFVAVHILDVEVGVEAEPLLIFTFVEQLNKQKATPFSFRFSSRGSNYSWMFSSNSLIPSFQRLL